MKEKEKEEIKEEDLYYKYYDEFLRGYVLIPIVNSDYYNIFGYKYKDKELVEYFAKKKINQKNENSRIANIKYEQ